VANSSASQILFMTDPPFISEEAGRIPTNRFMSKVGQNLQLCGHWANKVGKPEGLSGSQVESFIGKYPPAKPGALKVNRSKRWAQTIGRLKAAS
jgi:hypothetical protein